MLAEGLFIRRIKGFVGAGFSSLEMLQIIEDIWDCIRMWEPRRRTTMSLQLAESLKALNPKSRTRGPQTPFGDPELSAQGILFSAQRVFCGDQP